MKKNILNGSINNYEYKYRWVSNDNACEQCMDLNGNIYHNTSDIPDKPHPNCRCYLELIQENKGEIYENNNEEEDYINYNNKNNDKKPNNELCDCAILYEEFEKISGDINSLKEEIEALVSQISSSIRSFVTNKYKQIGYELLSKAQYLDNGFGDFARNYNDMVEADTTNADKYFHAKANCQAAQRGEIEAFLSSVYSILREFEDGFRHVVIMRDTTLKEQIKDALKDNEANREGRELGRKYPQLKPSALLRHRIPDALDEKYW